MADPFLSDVKALFHFDSANKTFDNAGHTVVETGTIQTASVAGQFGDAVMDCANGAYLSITHADMVIPSEAQWTIEARVSVPSGLTVSSTQRWFVAGNSSIAIGVAMFAGDSKWYFAVRNAGQPGAYLIDANLTTRDVLTHIAISRGAGLASEFVLKTFVEGEEWDSLQGGQSPGDTMYFGNLPGSAFPGKVEEIRFTQNITRYTGAFTPPGAAFDDPVAGPSGAPIATLPLSVTVAAPVTGSSALPLSVTVAAPVTGSSALALRVSVLPTAYLSGIQSVCVGAGQAAIWREIVTVDGSDIANQLIGDVLIDAGEGEARIAEFTLRPPDGTTLELAGWTGLPVTIDIADYSTGSPLYAMRLFSGVIDTPSLDKTSSTLSMRCTDDLQGRCESMSNAELRALIGGYESTAVFDKAAVGWDYARDRLSTVTAALDISPDGEMRVTQWQPKVTPDLTLDASVIGDNSLRTQIAGRSQLVNEVLVEFGYRFPRVKAEGWPISWAYVDPTNFAQFLLDQKWFLQRQQVPAAISAAGGHLEYVSYIPLPNYVVPVGAGYFSPSSADLDLCQGFAALVSFDYAQTTTETHYIAVRNQKSIDQIGLRQTQISGALTGAYPDITAAETGIRLYKDKSSGIPPADSAPIAAEKTSSADTTLTTETDRSAANAAMEALIAIAKAKIWASHRQNRITAVVPLSPAIDLDKTIALNADGIAARGKVVRVVHRLSSSSGSATTEFDIALCSVAGYGITHNADPTAAPAGTSAGLSNLTGSVNITYNAGNTEDHRITITFPGVEEIERANANPIINTTIAAPLVEDLFTVTI